MTRSARSLVRLVVGLSALFLTGVGGAAFASVGPPDPTGYSGPATPSVTTSGLSFWAVLLIAIVAVAIGALTVEIVHMVRRHRPTYGAATA